MKITLMQMDTVWADPAENAARISRLMDANPGSDLYVLPEMFSTGFITDSAQDSEHYPYPTLGHMQEWADSRGCAIAGSIAMEVDGSYRNRLCFVRPGGDVSIYDKRHLFTYGGEDRKFSGGCERVIAEWKGIRFLLLVCYDLRFPVWARNRKDYDAIICVANWPQQRASAWDMLTRARAIENQAFVVCVNRAGRDKAGIYRGGSALIGPRGETLASCEDFRESVVTGEIRMDDLEWFRREFPVLDDADGFRLF